MQMRHTFHTEVTVGESVYFNGRLHTVTHVVHRDAYVPFIGPPVGAEWVADLEPCAEEPPTVRTDSGWTSYGTQTHTWWVLRRSGVRVGLVEPNDDGTYTARVRLTGEPAFRQVDVCRTYTDAQIAAEIEIALYDTSPQYPTP